MADTRQSEGSVALQAVLECVNTPEMAHNQLSINEAASTNEMDLDESSRGEKRGNEDVGFQTVTKRMSYKPRAVVEKDPVPVQNRYTPITPRDAIQEKKPPPIVISPPISQMHLKKMLRERGISSFSLNSSDKETRVYLNTEADRYKATLIFRECHEVQFHTFAPRGTKRSNKYVLYGFDIDYEVEEITAELNDRLEGFKLARRLTKRNCNGDVRPMEGILIVTEHNVTLKAIAGLRHICDVKFRVTTFKEDGGPVQCRNCQQYGHTMKYCDRRCICARCGEPHLLSQCTAASAPKCSNCQQGHLASSKECPHRMNLIREIKNRRAAVATATTASPPRRSSRIVQDGLDYSAVIGGARSQSGEQPHPQDHPHHQSTEPTQTTQPDLSLPRQTSQRTEASLTALVEKMFARMEKLMEMLTTVISAVLRPRND